MNCRHALGVDCDVARLLFESGLEILSMDMAVDGYYQFMCFMVRLMLPMQIEQPRSPFPSLAFGVYTRQQHPAAAKLLAHLLCI